MTGPAAPQPPIANLLDIKTPDPVAFWPPAPGWWLLAAAGLGVLAFVALKLHARRRRNAYRRAATTALQAAWRTYETDRDGDRYVQTLNQLLKRTALAAYARHRVAELSGESWGAFLAGTAGTPALAAPVQAFLQTAPYRRGPAETGNLAEIHRFGLAWVKRHRPTAEFPYA